MTTLHYIHDPLCGWCYAAQDMVELAAHRLGDTARLALHGGGLFSGTVLPQAKRQQIRESDRRIGELTGQLFGPAYLDGLLADPASTYDSGPPIAAIRAAEQLHAHAGLPMLNALQRAHYRAGQRIGEPAVQAEAARSIGLVADDFMAALTTQGEEAARHIAATRRWMREIGAGSFPSFFLEHEGKTARVPHEPHYGEPERFVDALYRQLQELA